jgi:aminoglycoside phosphotransferase (APT) family kinase protein
MQRVEGIDMLDAIPRSPKGLRGAGVQLAQLHEQLAAIPAPDWLASGPAPAGDQIVHLDLHPMNVMITADGPVVIDWANASRGHAATEVANTWALLHAGEVSGSWFERATVAVGRGLLLRTFLKQFDLSASKKAMPALVEWRIAHGRYSASEQRKMRALAASFR